jgi:hypothetical protein
LRKNSPGVFNCILTGKYAVKKSRWAMDVISMWFLSLGIAGVVIVIVAVLLGAIIAAAKSIDRNAAGIWTVGKQIAGNTVSIWMLEKTLEKVDVIDTNVKGMGKTFASIDERLRVISEESGRKR